MICLIRRKREVNELPTLPPTLLRASRMVTRKPYDRRMSAQRRPEIPAPTMQMCGGPGFGWVEGILVRSLNYGDKKLLKWLSVDLDLEEGA